MSVTSLEDVCKLTIANTRKVTEFPNVLCIPDADLLLSQEKGFEKLVSLEFSLRIRTSFASLEPQNFEQFGAAVVCRYNCADSGSSLTQYKPVKSWRVTFKGYLKNTTYQKGQVPQYRT
jgi:hypothetical protein